MCGIVGYISNNDKLYEGPKHHFMRHALALDTLRGEDSTGLMTFSKRFTLKTLKTTMAGDRFVHSPEYKKKFKPGWAQVGHNRAATRGKVVVDNAHPFTFGDVTMVHNGTLWGGGHSLETYDAKIGDVDSMQIAYALSKYPPEKAAEVLSQIDGSFALVWSDRRDESINMARNEDRPLHFTFNPNKSILWYMSDGYHLHSINKSFGQHECKGTTIFEMDRHKILKFRKGDTKPHVTEFKGFTRPVTTYTGGAATSSKGKSRGGLERATEKWKRSLESASTRNSTDGKGSPMRVMLQGRKRRVPSCMQKLLKEELFLDPDDLLQFQPDDAVKMANGNYVVYGTVLHREWDDTPWDMTIHNVQTVQYNAYKDQDWLVRPIGLCPAHSYDTSNAAVLGHLVHCDWDSYSDTIYPVGDDDTDDTEGDSIRSPEGKLLVPGPDGHMMEWQKLQPMLDRGCINCGGDVDQDPITDMLCVNNGQDLICPGCTMELTASTATVN